jgi:hypothetical protein
MFGSAQTDRFRACSNDESYDLKEINMYIGGALGTILLICLIVWVLRRA